jgi:hypothetical protein
MTTTGQRIIEGCHIFIAIYKHTEGRDFWTDDVADAWKRKSELELEMGYVN